MVLLMCVLGNALLYGMAIAPYHEKKESKLRMTYTEIDLSPYEQKQIVINRENGTRLGSVCCFNGNGSRWNVFSSYNKKVPVCEICFLGGDLYAIVMRDKSLTAFNHGVRGENPTVVAEYVLNFPKSVLDTSDLRDSED